MPSRAPRTPHAVPPPAPSAPHEAAPEILEIRRWVRAAVVLSALGVLLSGAALLSRWTGRTATLEGLQKQLAQNHAEDSRERQALSRELKDELRSFWEDLTGKH